MTPTGISATVYGNQFCISIIPINHTLLNAMLIRVTSSYGSYTTARQADILIRHVESQHDA